MKMVVAGVSRVAPSVAGLRRRGEKGGFGLAAEFEGRAQGTVSSSNVSMASLLSVQEAQSDVQQDRAAREHGQAVVEELVTLQRALLGGKGADTARLVELVQRPVLAADPMLAGLLRAIRVRAGVELARRERAASG